MNKYDRDPTRIVWLQSHESACVLGFLRMQQPGKAQLFRMLTSHGHGHGSGEIGRKRGLLLAERDALRRERIKELKIDPLPSEFEECRDRSVNSVKLVSPPRLRIFRATYGDKRRTNPSHC
jgi:hypothetical protein